MKPEHRIRLQAIRKSIDDAIEKYLTAKENETVPLEDLKDSVADCVRKAFRECDSPFVPMFEVQVNDGKLFIMFDADDLRKFDRAVQGLPEEKYEATLH